MTTIQVWRVEHDCDLRHGPLQPCRENPGTWDAPNYGAIRETPQQDPMLKRLFVEDDGITTKWASNWFFGTLPWQFPYWWSVDRASHKLANRWVAACYEVPESDCVIGQWQAVFKRTHARIVKVTQTEFPKFIGPEPEPWGWDNNW